MVGELAGLSVVLVTMCVVADVAADVAAGVVAGLCVRAFLASGDQVNSPPNSQ